jgi:glycosyltransferase involved in cell wall biosynthesis
MNGKQNTIIGFDAKRIVRNATGLGNYGRTLINNIVKVGKDKFDIRLYAPDKGLDALRERVNQNERVKFVYPKDKYFRIEKDLWRYKDIVKNLSDDGVDIYHGLSGELPLGLHKSGIHGIVTIHDLIFLRHPEYYSWIDAKIYAYKFRVTCRQAERIIAISECTKRDIIEFGHVDPDKIKVIYQDCSDVFKHPVDQERKTSIRLYYGLPKRYVLNVGSIEERKNVLLAIKALLRLPNDISLVIVGKCTSYMNKIFDYIEENNLSKRVLILNDVSFTDLPAVYQMAEVFVYPSRYEGFGIPIIEAIHSGIPVVASTGSCLEEAGGPDNLYVDPDDDSGMATAIERLLVGAYGRDNRIERSRSFVNKFDENEVANQMIEEYKYLMRW